MRNKVDVTIGGKKYTMVAVENEEYVLKCAGLVDRQLSEVSAGSRLPQVDAAVLAAANLAHELLKQQAAAENLRRQLKGYLDEANKAKAELGECKRQLLKLQQKK